MPLIPSERSDRTEPVFVYGTLMNPWIRSYACWCRTASEPVVLVDYRKVGLNIVPDPQSQVHGHRIMLSPEELARVDRYEDTPRNYRRARIEIDDVSHWVYFKNE